MGKPDRLSRRSGEEKCGMDANLFEQGQHLYLGKDENDNEGNAEDHELEGIDVSQWDKRNGLCLVPHEHRLKVLRQHYNCQVAAHWGRHRTQELVSRNFTWHRFSKDVANYDAG